MKLLICEDERDLASALATILKRHNYTVDVVHDGKDALEYIELGQYDGIILDIMMPELDGLSVLSHLRQQENPIPVLILSAKSQVDDKVQGLDLGADDYLTKPFEAKELLARLRLMFRKSIGVKSNALQFADLTLNQETFTLKCGNDEVSLNNKEYQVMAQFMMNPSYKLSVDNLFDKVWGFDSESDVNVVWVYISNLRKKLLSIHSKVTIKVARNVGYYLEAEDEK